MINHFRLMYIMVEKLHHQQKGYRREWGQGVGLPFGLPGAQESSAQHPQTSVLADIDKDLSLVWV